MNEAVARDCDSVGVGLGVWQEFLNTSAEMEADTRSYLASQFVDFIRAFPNRVLESRSLTIKVAHNSLKEREDFVKVFKSFLGLIVGSSGFTNYEYTDSAIILRNEEVSFTLSFRRIWPNLILDISKRFLGTAEELSAILHKNADTPKNPPFGDQDRSDASSLEEEKKRKYVALVIELFGLTPEAAEAEYEQRLSQIFSLAAIPLYRDRPKGQDAIDFYQTHWSEKVSTGQAYREDIEKYDFPLIDGVFNACNYRAKNGGKAADHYPDNFPPPRNRDASEITPAGKRRANVRARQARYQSRKKEDALTYSR